MNFISQFTTVFQQLFSNYLKILMNTFLQDFWQDLAGFLIVDVSDIELVTAPKCQKQLLLSTILCEVVHIT